MSTGAMFAGSLTKSAAKNAWYGDEVRPLFSFFLQCVETAFFDPFQGRSVVQVDVSQMKNVICYL